MNKKEFIRIHMEKERRKLNVMVESGEKVEEMYLQSLVVDRLIELYMTAKE